MRGAVVAVAIVGTTAVSAIPRHAGAENPSAKMPVAALDPALPAHQRSGHLTGRIRVFSDETMKALTTLWSEGFARFHPGAQFKLETTPSTPTAASTLVERRAETVAIPREMLPDEAAEFARQRGYAPLRLRVAGGTYRNLGKNKETRRTHAIAVFVNRANPIERISLSQLDAIYSKTRKRRYKGDVTTWGSSGPKGIGQIVRSPSMASRDRTAFRTSFRSAFWQAANTRRGSGNTRPWARCITSMPSSPPSPRIRTASVMRASAMRTRT